MFDASQTRVEFDKWLPVPVDFTAQSLEVGSDAFTVSEDIPVSFTAQSLEVGN